MNRANSRAAVLVAAFKWLGTPYHHHGRIKGVGVDCAQFLCAVYEDVGIVSHVDPGNYPHDWHMNRSEELFLGWLNKVGARQIETPEAGDIAVFKYGRTFSHGAIMLDKDTVIHSYINMGVIVNRLDESPLANRDVQYWSIF